MKYIYETNYQIQIKSESVSSFWWHFRVVYGSVRYNATIFWCYWPFFLQMVCTLERSKVSCVCVCASNLESWFLTFFVDFLNVTYKDRSEQQKANNNATLFVRYVCAQYIWTWLLVFILCFGHTGMNFITRSDNIECKQNQK